MPSPYSLRVRRNTTVDGKVAPTTEDIDISGSIKLEETISAGQTRKIYVPRVRRYSASTPAVAAELASVAGGLTISAVTAGVAGNSITFRTVAGSGTTTTTFAAIGNAITATLAKVVSAKATLINQGITYEAKTIGTTGNSTQIHLIDPGVLSSTGFNLNGPVVEITLAHDGNAIIETATSLISSFISSAPQGILDLIDVTGAGSSPLSALSATNLTGGLDALAATIATVVSDFVAANIPAVKALVDISGIGNATATVVSATNLTGGLDIVAESSIDGTIADVSLFSISLVDASQYAADTAGPSSFVSSLVAKIVDVNGASSGVYKLDLPFVVTNTLATVPAIGELFSDYPSYIEVTNNKAVDVTLNILVGFNTAA